MKKIKNTKQLITEKSRLKQRRAELEKAIKYDLRDVKESLSPRNIAAQVLSGFFEDTQKQDESGMHENTSQHTGTLKIIAEKVLSRISKWIKK